MANITLRSWKTLLNWRSAIWFWILLAAFGIPLKTPAHICGPTVMIQRPGDLFYYYILADIFETQPSIYSLNTVSNPAVVTVFPSYTFPSFWVGAWQLSGLQQGQTDVTFNWTYAPFSASGTCAVHIIITNSVRSAAANYSQSAFGGDPVNAYTGALVMNEAPDLDLGGPMPLQFWRVHDSALSGSLLIRSELGLNWAHNFDTRMIRLSNRVDMVTFQGLRAQFLKTNNVWTAINSQGKSYQVVESVSGSNTNLVVGDRKSNLIYMFNPAGELVSISDGKGNTHTLTYVNNALTQVSDGLGRVINFQTGGFYQLAAISDGTRTVSFGYSPDPSVPQLLSVTNPIGGVTTYTYDSGTGIPGLLAAKTLPRGNTPYTQVYDSFGRVVQQIELNLRTNKFVYGSGSTSVTNPLGGAKTYTHNTNGQLTGYTDEANTSVALTVNTNGQRSQLTDRSGNKTGFGYDATSGKISSVTNADGAVTSFSYTSYSVSNLTFYVLSAVSYPDGTSESYTYDGVGNVVSRTDRQGGVWTYTYNNHGQPLTVQNPRGGVTTLTYNADCTLASSGDSDLGTTTYSYDSFRRLVQITHPDSSTTSSLLDNNNRVTSITDERGNTYFYYYDANGNVTNIVDPNSAAIRYAYDGLDRAISETDRLGNSQSCTFDALDRLATFTDKNGLTTSVAYDVRGRMNAVTNPAGGVWKLGYTPEGTRSAITNPMGQVFTRRIDPEGYVTGRTNPLHNASSTVYNSRHDVTDFVDELNNTTHFGYDMGRVSSETRPRIGSVSMERDSLGNVEQYTDFNGRKWVFGYSNMGRTKTFDPAGWSIEYGYNSRGWNTMTTFGDGLTRANTLDVAGNLMLSHNSDGADFGYTYDKLNRPISGKWITMSLDAEGRPTNTTYWGVNFGATYAPDWRITSATWNANFKVDYYYDTLRRLIMASNSQYGAWVRLGYDDADNVSSITRGNGVNSTITRNNNGAITRLQDGAFLDFQYTLDAASRHTQINYTAPLDPVKFVTPFTMSFHYNSASQISDPGFSYSGRGLMTAGMGVTYGWNGASQLTSAGGISYQYDGWDQMASRTDATSNVRYYYNMAFGRDRIAGEFDVNANQYSRMYVWAPNGPLLFIVDPIASKISYPHYCSDGSIMALTDGGGTVTDAYAYGQNGVFLGHTGTSTQPYTYLGGYGVKYDFGANLYKIGARWYSPTYNSYLSPDTSWPHLDNPQSTPYSFANNDPLDYFNAGGFGGVPLYNKLFSNSKVDEPVRVPTRSMYSVTRIGDVEIPNFPRIYDYPQKVNGDEFGSGLRGSLLSAYLPGGYGDDCCCCDCCCCCCDCCCCDCCCCDCCDYGPPVISLTSLIRGGTYTPIRTDPIFRGVGLTETYRKFGMMRVLPRASTYMPLSLGNKLPILSPARAVDATEDRRQERNYDRFNFGLGLGRSF